jgi:hypothetical protein
MKEPPTVSRAAVALALSIAVCPEPAARAEEPSSPKEIIRALDELRERYGIDAVRLQTLLLQAAIGGGSVLEASAGIGGIEEHGGKRYLRFDLVTGIVYDDQTIAADARPARIWIDVVDPTLRHFTAIDVPADGVALHIVYQHAAYRDRTELLRKHVESPAPSDEMHLRLASGEIVEFAHSRLAATDFLDRSSVLLNGKPARIDLSAVPPSQTPAAPSHPLFPEDAP